MSPPEVTKAERRVGLHLLVRERLCQSLAGGDLLAALSVLVAVLLACALGALVSEVAAVVFSFLAASLYFSLR